MDTAAWEQAAHPPEVVVLGLRLRPFCLGHQILLAHAGSEFMAEEPFTRDGVDVFQELAAAVLICSHDYRNGLKLVQSRRLPLGVKIWRWVLKRRKIIDLEEELRAFAGYLKAANWFPDLNLPKSRSLEKMGSPSRYRWLAFLMAAFRMSEDQALNYPLSRAATLYAAVMEQRGLLDIYSESDEALFALQDKLNAEGFAWN